jgi:hypothetical protein
MRCYLVYENNTWLGDDAFSAFCCATTNRREYLHRFEVAGHGKAIRFWSTDKDIPQILNTLKGMNAIDGWVDEGEKSLPWSGENHWSKRFADNAEIQQ